MKNSPSLQEIFAPSSICFGCGPANKNGLQIRSFFENNRYICNFKPENHHQAFPGIINGGIIGSILDCHCNWTAAMDIMKNKNLQSPLCTVTAEYTIKLHLPTPAGHELKLISWSESVEKNRATVKGELFCQDKLTASCQGTFIAVKEGHPAFHRWS